MDTTDVAYGPETAFDEGDEIRFKAVGLPSDTEVDVYMVYQGDDFFTGASVSLTDQRADGKITLTTNSDGTLTGTLISSTAIVNRPASNSACCSGNTALYKIVIDVNQDGVYKKNDDVVDSHEVDGGFGI